MPQFIVDQTNKHQINHGEKDKEKWAEKRNRNDDADENSNN